MSNIKKNKIQLLSAVALTVNIGRMFQINTFKVE